jgi:hypothetical protein
MEQRISERGAKAEAEVLKTCKGGRSKESQWRRRTRTVEAEKEVKKQ